MKTVASLIAVATLAASMAAPASAQSAAFQRVSQQDYQRDCYRGETYEACRQRLSYGYDNRGNPYGRSYGSQYGGQYGGSYGGGSDRDPRYYDRGGYYDQYVRPGAQGGYSTGYGYNNGSYNSGGYYGGNSGYYGNGYNNNGYRQDDTDWGAVAGAVLGVALGVAIIGSLDDRDHYDRYRDDRRYRDHCRRQYRSWDSNSGTYLGNDGYRRYCRWN